MTASRSPLTLYFLLLRRGFPAIHRGKYFIGGAAGFVEPARGFGLKYAFLSGLFAVKSITSNTNYDTLWKESFLEELYEGYGRRSLLNNLKTTDYEKFVEEKKINIEDYEKTPDSFKNKLLKINTKVMIEKLKKQYNFDILFEA